jgi:hypothetical protein
MRSDIDRLIDALDRDGNLGRLTSMSEAERVREFEERALKQLLVAMIGVTSGRDLKEKALDEYRQLNETERQLYGVLAVASMHRFTLTKRELLGAAGGITNQELGALDELRTATLIVDQGERFALRHRVIAEELIRQLERTGELFAPYLALARGMAVDFVPNRPESRVSRILKTLINNDRLTRSFRVEEVRRFYADLQDLLSADYHYWLQRGTFEVNRNRLRLAEPYLQRALAIGGADFRVQVEYALFLYRKALAGDWADEAASYAREARSLLEEQIAAVGAHNPYPHHVLLKQELAWLQETVHEPEALYGELSNLRLIAGEALRQHPDDRRLRQARTDVERAILELAVPKSRGRKRQRSRAKRTPRSSKGSKAGE